MSTNARWHTAVESERLHVELERVWKRLDVLRNIIRDEGLRGELGLSPDVLLLVYERVLKEQKQAEARHFEAMDAHAQLAEDLES